MFLYMYISQCQKLLTLWPAMLRGRGTPWPKVWTLDLTFGSFTTGRSLHYQVEHHVGDKFATPILYVIDNFKFYDIFSTYT